VRDAVQLADPHAAHGAEEAAIEGEERELLGLLARKRPAAAADEPRVDGRHGVIGYDSHEDARLHGHDTSFATPLA